MSIRQGVQIVLTDGTVSVEEVLLVAGERVGQRLVRLNKVAVMLLRRESRALFN